MEDLRKRKKVLSLEEKVPEDLRKPKKVLSSSEAKVVKSNWSDLHLDLLVLVVRTIESVKDYFAFRGVCKPWRRVAAYENFKWTRRLPFLVQAKNERVEFSNPLAIQQQPPAIYYTIANMKVHICVGCKGWILVVEKNGNMILVHIMSGAHIRLPRHERSYSNFNGIYKMVLSSSPLTNPLNCTLVIVYGCAEMAYWRYGDKTFTEVWSNPVSDVIYSSKAGYFYGLSVDGHILLIMGNDHEYPTTLAERSSRILVRAPYESRFRKLSTFLVELDGDLLLVAQGRGVTRFRVYKIEALGELYCRATEVKNLGNRAIFVGGSSASFSVNASEIPGCKPNRIYFTGHGQKYTYVWNKEKHHMGVYNLEDGLVEYFGCSGILSNELCSCYCPPLWVTPAFV